IVRDDSLKKQVLSRIDSRVLTISGNNQLWSKDNSRKLECELRALPQRKHVDYTEFHKDTSYLNWVDEKKKLWAQESEWKKHSEIVKAKSDEAIAYVKKYWSVQNITQIKAGTEPMLKEMWQAFDKAKEQKIRCEARVSYANKKCEEVKKLCKAYEAEWDAKQKAKAEAEKEAEIRALRRKEAMKKVAVAAIILGIALVVFTGYKIKEYNEVKQSIAEYGLFGGVLDMEDYIDENGTLTLPSEVRGVTYSNICYMPLPEGVKKLIIPEGVVKISGYDNYEMDKYSPIGFVCSTLEEIEFPDSLETIYCKFKCPSLRTFSAENVTSVWHYGDNNLNALTLGYFFQSLDRLTSVHLPKLEQVYDSTFEGCRSLQELNVQGAQTVGVNAFKDCSSLTYLYLPTAWKLDMHVFENCSSLKAVYVPALKEMDAYAFSFINSLNGAVQVVLDTNGAYDETLMGSLQAAEERGEIVIMYQDYTQLDPAQLDELHQM
ncbi:MAG: leucine-rich repeat protein, partial [Lachnospiraceae bacterium]|nr:leucine-rich repeat protein [Lachnospiraceae bacterium]